MITESEVIPENKIDIYRDEIRPQWQDSSTLAGARNSNLFGPQDHRHHALRFSCLGALVDQDRAELHLGQTRIPGSNAGTTDHISILGTKKKQTC